MTAVTLVAFDRLVFPATHSAESTIGGATPCVLSNQTNSSIVVEQFSYGSWSRVPTFPGKDSSITGNKIRVTTERKGDKANITVEREVAGGKKYILIRNEQMGIWDFKDTIEKK